MEKRDLRHLKRKELIDLIDKMQTESDLVSNVEVKKELGRLEEREKYLKHLRKTLSVLVVVAAISVLVATLWMPVLKIYGSSMDPTLENGQIVVSIKTKKLKSGDVVAFWQGNKLLVKRVIAGPGQKVDIDVNGKVSVDGKAISESYLDSESLGNTDIDFPHQVEESRWFCMGDNRERSIDSRSAAIGDISKEQIEGKVLFSVWPLNKIGIVK
ncbi:signal peptidase I [Holdemanella biformis]|uniref:signal peptidase I n=1 Tax=Holdemanella biformis TaxID=1735 RepID=UPI001C3934B1|nr:signal peptidase I [Holdemanella biformis]MBV4131576.1 signal peptidase I [Holdemanella biformis]MBV4151301.1 signal peptidase I [Holdemanella biformis]